MPLLPLRDLILPKEIPQTTLSLLPALRSQAAEMVEAYIFTDTIRARFTEILETVVQGRGQGFWVQAEYGAGKTHFLVVLASLLCNLQPGLWDRVSDDEIRQYQRRLGHYRLFPVILSLRGQAGDNPSLDRSLFDVLLEEGFQDALQHAQIEDQVRLTSAQDLWDWLQNSTSDAIRREADDFVRRATGYGMTALRDAEGMEVLGRQIAEYCRQSRIKPAIASSVKDRLVHIYNQITAPDGPGYDGVLVVIDEYEGWQSVHNTSQQLTADAELLETLAYLLPRDLNCRVFTVVASQSSVPAKLRGDQSGDRFISVALLARENERDYDVIVSRRVRGLNEARLPEINDYYEYCRHHFAFARELTLEQFQDTFPFQPRCFEVVRHITARDLPTTRSGLFVFWETANQAHLLARNTLIRISDLLASRHLTEDCMATPAYSEAYTAFRAAGEALDLLDLEPADLPLARDILATLFLWHLAYLETPRRMSVHELAEATLSVDDVIRAEDNVILVLSQIRSLPQIDFDSDALSAAFVVAGSAGPSPLVLFNEEKRRVLQDQHRLRAALTDSLFFTPRDTGGATGLFSDFQLDQRAPRRIHSRNLEYPGEVVVASGWRLDHGGPLPSEDVHFRLVILTPSAAHPPQMPDFQDRRIALVLPGEMTDEIRDAAAGYEAWRSLEEHYRNRTGQEAEAMRAWLSEQRRSILDRLVGTHLRLYGAGRVITRDDLAIDPRDAFGRGGDSDLRIAALVEPLLLAAYSDLPVQSHLLRSPLTPAEVGKVFAGYFDPGAPGAARAALRNYGLALGLSHPDQPERFAPQSPRTFALLESMLAEAGGADLPVWRIYERLSGMPYGLPYVVIQLYLLAFVRRGSCRVDLTLKQRHGLQTRQRRPVTAGRLTASTVTDIEWKPGLQNAFDSLVPAVGPSWNDTLAYAREMSDSLHQSTDQADIADQTIRLRRSIDHLREQLDARWRNLEALAGTLGRPLPATALNALERLQQLVAETPETHADFYRCAAEVFEESPDQLRDAMQTYGHLCNLADYGAEVVAVKRYLDEVALRDTDRDLAADRMTLAAQISLDELVARPEAWHHLREEFNQFRARYQNEYQKHHRDYYQAAAQLRGSLEDAPRRLQALGLLNQIEALGTPLGGDLEARYRSLVARLAPCPVTVVSSVSVEHAPTCSQCPRPLRLTDVLPISDVNEFLAELERALDDKRRQLASETISRVLARGRHDAMETFVEAVRAADLAALVDVMSPELADFIERLLAEESIVTAPADILSELVRRFPNLEEGEIDTVVQALRQLLCEAFAAARRANPDKKMIRLTLR